MNQVHAINKTAYSLRSGEFWVLVSLLLGSIAIFNGLCVQTLLERSIKDSGHTLVFTLATYLLLGALHAHFTPRGWRFGSVIAAGFGLAFVTGVAIELLQPLVGRNASFLDIWYDLLGTAAGILLFSARVQLTSLVTRMSLTLLAVLVMSISVILPAYYWHLERTQKALFPVLFDFEASWQSEFIRPRFGAHFGRVRAPAGWAGNTSFVARLDIAQGAYPGLDFEHLPADWRGYDHLYLDVFSKQPAPVSMTLRIHDHAHTQQYEDRFNRSFSIKPGMNKLLISLQHVKNAPRDREMHMDQIAELMLFAVDPDNAFSLYLDNIRLD